MGNGALRKIQVCVDAVVAACNGVGHNRFVIPFPDIPFTSGDSGVVLQVILNDDDICRLFAHEVKDEVTLVERSAGESAAELLFVKGTSLRHQPHSNGVRVAFSIHASRPCCSVTYAQTHSLLCSRWACVKTST